VFLKVITITTGLVVAGEAAALLVGMYILSPQPNPWISGRNSFWVGLDIVCGIGLICLILMPESSLRDGLLMALALIATGSHAYREWEYFASSAASRFLVNVPLFVLNNVKLIGLILIAGMIVISFFRNKQ
jgi:hypothetical protein